MGERAEHQAGGHLRRWSIKVLLPHALCVLALLFTVNALLPPFWGSPGLAFKIEYVEEANEPYDRLFIGSSHLFRQVDPHLLDSVMADDARSFNLALNASFSPESDLALEHILSATRQPPRVICMELMPYMHFEEKNFEHYRYWYYVDASTCMTLARHTWSLGGMDLWERLAVIGRHIRALLYASAAPGLRDRFIGEGSVLDTATVMGPAYDGHVPFEWQYEREPDNETLRQRRESLRTDTDAVARRQRSISRAYAGGGWSSFSPIHKHRLDQLIRLADRRGVRLLFVLPPLWLEKDEDFLALFRSLPPERRIDLSDPSGFPEFYRTENAFDAGHLNSRGSRLFTLHLAERLKGLGHSATGAEL